MPVLAESLLKTNPSEMGNSAFSPEEAQALFDATARLYMGMSGSEFLREWDAQRFDLERHSQAVRVAALIPLVRRTRAREKSL
jgi:hypothetical protein